MSTSATLTHHLAQIGAHRQGIRTAREKLLDRAQEQLDSIGPTIETLEAAVQAGVGDELSARRLRTLLTERSRLTQILNPRLER
jgi:chorismate synthase